MKKKKKLDIYIWMYIFYIFNNVAIITVKYQITHRHCDLQQ